MPANYTAVIGVTEPGADGEGLFFRNSKIEIKDIRTATVRQLPVGERSQQTQGAADPC